MCSSRSPAITARSFASVAPCETSGCKARLICSNRSAWRRRPSAPARSSPMAKRVELAIALANDPRLLLMDEPTAGMAPRERTDLIALVKRLVIERNISVLFTEHSMDVVFAYADRIIVLARGRLIAEGSSAAIRDNPQVQQVYLGTGRTFTARLAAPS